MNLSNPRAGWDKVGNQFYRRLLLYEAPFDPDFELENYLVAGAPYGGALGKHFPCLLTITTKYLSALYRDETKVTKYRGPTTARSTIDIYSCAGKLISQLHWDREVVRGLGWSDDEQLIVVTQSGTVRCYNGFHGEFNPFLLGHGAEDHGVVTCRFWLAGFVALLGNNVLVAVSSYDEPRPKVLAEPPKRTVHSWSLVPPAYTLSRTVEILLATEQTIHVIDAQDSEDRGLSDGPFKHVRVSPNGRFVALFTEDGKVWVVSSDFQNKLSEYDSKAKTLPKHVEWCGNDSVVLAWEDEVHMVGPNGAASKHYYEGQVHVVPDLDGVRLIAHESCEFLQKVPDEIEEVFKLGSTSPAAVLLDSIEQLERRSPKADENIQRIKPYLPEAVDTCVRAAGHEYNTQLQKKLLKAASFGKSALNLYNSDDFVDMCERLRVLNAVRDYRVGLSMTYEQFASLGPERLISRLMNRHEYLLAIEIAGFLRLPASKIYVHWASQKVKTDTADDDAICDLIVSRLKNKPGISFASISQAAYEEGRSHLATSLLDSEPRAGKQVPLLLKMEEDEIALDKAIESGDTDLVFFVLLQLKKKLPLASFFRVINSRPMASALVASSAKNSDTGLLKDMYYQDDRAVDGANLLFEEALRQTQIQTKTDKLKLAARLLKDSKDPTAQFHTKGYNEATQLLRMQEAFDKEVSDGSRAYTGLSVNETMYQLMQSGYTKRATKVQNEFKVPEKTFWWVRLRALVAARLWGELEEIGKNRKSPIGWEVGFPFLLS